MYRRVTIILMLHHENIKREYEEMNERRGRRDPLLESGSKHERGQEKTSKITTLF